MIVVVEGPSAAGKTTWARQWGARVVEELAPASPPAARSTDDVAAFFATRNADRWAAAVAIEAAMGTAVCDGDPLKIHYDYCTARVGAAAWDGFESAVRSARAAMRAHDMGVADLVVCSFPDDETLARRKAADATRARHRFGLHRRLGPPLRDWYRVLDELDPGRVAWELPRSLPEPRRRDRHDLALFDRWMASLPRP